MQKNSYLLHISGGQGPIECTIFVTKLIDLISADCKQRNVQFNMLEKVMIKNTENISSAVISIEGKDAFDIALKWQGTMQWVYKNPHRASQGRKNWFVGIEMIESDQVDTFFDEKLVKFETMRSSGPGGQHVNKTNSAVRAIYEPTGQVTISKGERSQSMNKKSALSQLKGKILSKVVQKQDVFKKSKWQHHSALERGNAKMVFYGENFEPEK